MACGEIAPNWFSTEGTAERNRGRRLLLEVKFWLAALASSFRSVSLLTQFTVV